MNPSTTLGKHPHVRGEDEHSSERVTRLTETPPRAWGRQTHSRSMACLSGNTPTCVGKTPARTGSDIKRWKHPHVRGEDLNDVKTDWGHEETPPRAWGRRCRDGQQPERRRNTPTCVGKTCAGWTASSESQKHPHVRGEDAVGCCGQAQGVETPPRAWGRRHEQHRAVHRRGNTPTCVGKTRYQHHGLCRLQKHPHVRGEDAMSREPKDYKAETPPRAWGRRCAARRSSRSKGNTPTCVGKTPPFLSKPSTTQKHPHVRGEDSPRFRPARRA